MAVPVRIQRLTKSFGDRRVLDEVQLDIAAGELFFLLGPSGCGKTTLLRCVAGFCEPDAGEIRIGGEDVTRVPPHRRDTGMVFQSYALWPHLTVRENVAFGLEQRKRPRAEIAARVEAALDRVRMRDRADDRPNQLSGGQQQRVALARALVVEPKCLLLDEPLSNLDAQLRLEMRGEIRRICKSAGLTTIYVTHDQKEALSVADRLAILEAGRVIQCGTPVEVYRRPANRFVAGFIGETNFLEGEVEEAIGGRVRLRTVWGPVVSAAPPAGAAAGARWTISLRPEVLRLDAPPPDAPNVFHAVVRESVYLGEVAQHRVAPAAGGEPTLKVFELHPRHLAVEGDSPIRLWFEPEDVVLLEQR
jgi:iron(III) transport system ATP-binding protein